MNALRSEKTTPWRRAGNAALLACLCALCVHIFLTVYNRGFIATLGRWRSLLEVVSAVTIAGVLAKVYRDQIRLALDACRHGLAYLERSRLNNSLVIGVIVFAAALVVRLIHCDRHARDPELAMTTGMCILGTPYSDARGHDVMGESLAEGRGLLKAWSANRPGYAFFLALAYTPFGPSTNLAIFLNLIASALTVSLIYLIGEKSFHRSVGLGAAACMMVEPMSLCQCLCVSTETVGLLFFVWALHMLMVGLERGRWTSFLASGVLFAFSNLVRPLTLVAIPTLLLCLCWIRKREGATWRDSARPGLVFLLGFLVTLTPWLVRQKLVHGIWSIADNCAGAFYAASDPRYGYWCNDIYADAERAGIPRTIKDQYDFFMQGFVANLQTHTLFYLENIASCCQKSFTIVSEEPDISRPLALVILGLSFLGTAGRLRHWTAQLASACFYFGVGWAVWVCPAWVNIAFTAAALLLSTVLGQHSRGLVIANCLCLTIIGSGLFGFPTTQRFSIFVNWLYVVYYLFSVHYLAALVWRLLFKPFLLEPTRNEGGGHPLTEPPPAPRWLTWSLRGVQAALAVLVLVGGCRLVYLNFVNPPLQVQLEAITERNVRDIVNWCNVINPGLLTAAEVAEPTDYSMGQGELVVLRGTAARHIYHIPTGVKVPHWSRFFKDRDYDCSYFFFRGVDCKDLHHSEFEAMVVFPGTFPASFVGEDVALIGRINYDPAWPCEQLLFEGVAVIPWAEWENGGERRRALVVRQPEHLQRLSDLQKVIGTYPGAASKRRVERGVRS